MQFTFQLEHVLLSLLAAAHELGWRKTLADAIVLCFPLRIPVTKKPAKICTKKSLAYNTNGQY